MDVIQEVEYVKQEAKMVYLLECLQKTAPPTIIFSDQKNEVDGEWSSFRRELVLMRYCRHPRVPAAEGSRGRRHSWFQEYVPNFPSNPPF
jgi:hypothetical protein